MKTVTLSDAKDKLSGYLDEVETEHEIVRITRHGRGSAVLISQDDLDSLRETIFWLSQPGIREDIAEARRSVEESSTMSADDVRTRYGLPPR
ncbi:type II toxin-antitoxin system Phd/YefM family antitoxin [Ruania alkalisoli]|uniref:Antitoxin n=1 Tax=Ruania alkalisoli TaxID=2779775 RepID=A0A7M1SPY5_9MICO|nr:type II toxin-antitoxin system Phd/YefM family antitoxin [Ruania alkalisoli]QOR69600.1 type II toxin-antitoxin system Phd/YefM family antitoxin [Ruania alkalisoli]